MSDLCEGCGHFWEVDAGRPTHDITSDGKLWCMVCKGKCDLITDLEAEAGRLRKRNGELVGYLGELRASLSVDIKGYAAELETMNELIAGRHSEPSSPNSDPDAESIKAAKESPSVAKRAEGKA